MKLSKEIKEKIKAEYEFWFEYQYGNSTQEERDKLGAFYTPPDITIAMIEKLPNLKGDILDPCCGAGNLLVGCIIAGADPLRVYGNEYEQRFVDIAKQRLIGLGVPECHIHRGDATRKECIVKSSFTKDYTPPAEYEQISLWNF